MKRVLEDTLTLIAGLGVGTAVMYLLDPDNGEARRQSLASNTRNRLGDATDAVASAGHRLADYSRGSMESAGTHMSDQAGRWSDSMGDYKQRLASAIESSRDYLPHLSGIQKAIRSKMPSRHHRSASDYVAPAVGITAGGAALVALGAGIAYFCDPDRGRARRAYLTDKTRALANDTGGFMRRTGKHLSNKVYGVAMEASRPIRKMRAAHSEGNAGREPSAYEQSSSQADATSTI